MSKFHCPSCGAPIVVDEGKDARIAKLEAALARRDALLRECLYRVAPAHPDLQCRIINELNSPERQP